MSTAIPTTLIPGDGIGPEIVDATLAALDALKGPFEWDRQIAGLEGVKVAGDPLPQATLASIRRTRLALKGPLETPSGGGRARLGIATNVLADRPDRLLGLSILRPTTDADRYGKGAYALTAKGIDLFPVLLAIQAWADKWLRERYRSPVKFAHRLCGQPLQLRVSCDGCGAVLSQANSRLVVG